MKEQFTPGPWHTSAKCRGVHSQNGTIADIWTTCNSEANRSANAHLAAAAPEMYRELDTFIAAFDDGDTIHIEPGSVKAERIRTLLAKARGEERT